MMRMGIDLGGTKIEVVALAEDSSELFRKRIPTPKNYPETLDAIVGLVNDAEAETQQTGSVGVGIPGVVSPLTGLVKNSNSTWINGHPLDKDLSARLDREVRVANDANCFAVSEAVDGAAAGKDVVFGVIIGTGCGGGLAINGKVHGGGNGIGGEWGHNPLPWMTSDEFNSTSCFCGNKDCIETFISGTGFVRDFRRAGGEADSGIQISQMMADGHPLATQAFVRFIDRLARSLAHLINMLDPDVIVLGGGVSNIDAIYTELPKVLPKYVVGRECDTLVVKNEYGASSGVRGAAWLWGKNDH
ncbi:MULTISPECIES: fructokinase [unclassified Shewanella]|uniref:fructokinase n=1 Tax=unclassified Shewanella TaxID=196818 RepID=UPI000C831AED|nr:MULTISPECIES: fructokinase [unclassified Shewanella]MDO6641911.1 fructokinase [Shewanella sp. 5_MG-2023]MDO6680250.1 fructokinase [Shewanella sp. 4_MG-2023]MDO6775891.1 fructokinase [Shewanella sp. 3_MG-2023]PMG29751.1 fructokinase [Shewanella sp. 10N.286.52.C2]PMG42879.1 fructokinase [Shewanella sp. 10N.286.52.B9]